MNKYIPLKLLAKQGIIAESETKPKNGNHISGEMKDTIKQMQGFVTSIPFDWLYSRNLKK